MREPILLTPGPLTTSLATKTAMLKDWGSWDHDFNTLTASVCSDLLAIAHGTAEHVCVPLQGSGTYAVEAAIANLLPRDGKLLVLINGAYGKRMALIAHTLGRAFSVYETEDDQVPEPATVARLLQEDPAISHVGLIHCETSTGILNPLSEIAAIVHAAGRKLIVDAMSSFGALDIDVGQLHAEAVIASSNKCLEGVPGMGFVIMRRDSLLASRGNSHSLALDLLAQYEYMQSTGQWRFTPPTHVVAALRMALDQYLAEGGQPARLARYQRNAAVLQHQLQQAGLQLFLPTARQAPIILTFRAPAHPDYRFGQLYEAVRNKGFVLYPGKLTSQETFRVGCIGAIDQAELEQACHAITTTIRELGWTTQGN
ncbi:2-aminoethylphosphonate--pyruvate transaminase [Aquitalea pelogenes]|uniref:2-aminoethylphosphonate--pyruvate transaminase n=1 Tax=Aquitalea pelogenes TaxID=1293573 RepID=UPI0035AE43F1